MIRSGQLKMSDSTGIVLIKHKKVSRKIHKKACTDDLKVRNIIITNNREYIKDMHYFYNI